MPNQLKKQIPKSCKRHYLCKDFCHDHPWTPPSPSCTDCHCKDCPRSSPHSPQVTPSPTSPEPTPPPQSPKPTRPPQSPSPSPMPTPSPSGPVPTPWSPSPVPTPTPQGSVPTPSPWVPSPSPKATPSPQGWSPSPQGWSPSPEGPSPSPQGWTPTPTWVPNPTPTPTWVPNFTPSYPGPNPTPSPQGNSPSPQGWTPSASPQGNNPSPQGWTPTPTPWVPNPTPTFPGPNPSYSPQGNSPSPQEWSPSPVPSTTPAATPGETPAPVCIPGQGTWCLAPGYGAYVGVALDFNQYPGIANYSAAAGWNPASYNLYVNFPLGESDKGLLNFVLPQIAGLNAIALITVEPWGGLDSCTEQAAADLADLVHQYELQGLTVIIRFAHEMNGR